ncbi:MAG: DUF2695 domain-containing protein [Nocardioidaceae bacterium]
MRNGGADEVAEQLVRELAEGLTAPRAGECFLCFVARMLDEFGCDGTLRFARRFRDRRAPRATALERRVGRRGGFCDCEIFLNAFHVCHRLRPPPPDVDGSVMPHVRPRRETPPCAGVRRGSTRPCDHWEEVPRGDW